VKAGEEHTMKFIHIADVHLGAKPDSEYPWGDQREAEIKESFKDLLDICRKEEVDLLLIAGDLFHRQPLLRELKELNYLFGQIPKTKVILIAGNHDYIGPKSHYIDFTWVSNVTMLKDDQVEKVFLPELNTEVYGFSHHRRNISEPKLEGVKPEQNMHYHILLAHGGDDKNVPMDRKMVKELPFDYIALGHIHKPTVLNGKCAFVGSFEPLDKNETGARGYIIGELSKSGVTTKFVPHSKRKYEWMEVAVTPEMTQGEVCDRISAMIHEMGEQNIYRIRLTGFKDVDIVFSDDCIKKLGNVIEILDDTVPDYDFEALKEDNQENIIGLYIDKIHESSTEDDIKNKALYYGLEALLNAKGRA